MIYPQLVRVAEVKPLSEVAFVLAFMCTKIISADVDECTWAAVFGQFLDECLCLLYKTL